ncbi:hypothetical protein C4D60_Mb03t06030 [Musa balbisiana]|uniref:Uncharacterized protein n=1 Tax=Musa balbisiana TaxID=52838 RepID=A0A4S8J7V4_MUSBA|nr:hypothetical protein C4D60_Mb03t06030 [Musa balbisiana]
MMPLKSLFGHHAIPGDKGHCSISNGSQEEVGEVSDEQMVAFTGERTHSPPYLIGNGPSRKGVQPIHPPPATHPEKLVQPQELPVDLCCVLEDLAKELPTTQVGSSWRGL